MGKICFSVENITVVIWVSRTVTLWLVCPRERRGDILSSRSWRSRSFCSWRSWTTYQRPASRKTSSLRMRTPSVCPGTTSRLSSCSCVRQELFTPQHKVELYNILLKACKGSGWVYWIQLWCSSMLMLQLEERKAENEAICESHREKIQQLWDRLQAPQEDRQLLNEHMVASRRRNLEAVRWPALIIKGTVSQKIKVV